MTSLKFCRLPLLGIILFLLTCSPPLSPIEKPPVNLTYSPAELAIYKDQAMTSIRPSHEGYADSFSCKPSLPDSLVFNTGNGAISGKAKAAQLHSSYTITALNSNTGAKTSCILGLTVYELPRIRLQPANQIISNGGRAEFSIVIEGGASPFHYQWYKGPNAVANGTAATLTILNATQADSGKYYCIAIDALGTRLSSDTVHCILSTAAAPVISTQPLAQNATIGSHIVFSVVASGTDLRYIWLKDGLPISNAVSSTYQIDSVTALHAGLYRAIVSNALGVDSSDTARLSVYQNSYTITVTINGTGNATCNSATVISGSPITIPRGSNAVISFSAPTGSSIQRVLIDGQEDQSARLIKGIAFSSIQANHTVAVTFAVNRYSVAVSSNDTASGTIKTIPSVIDTVSHHDTITLIAQPKPGHYFAGWSGSVPSSLRSMDTIGLRVDSALIITGLFAEIGKFPLSTTVFPQNSGTIAKSPDSSQYAKGTIVAVTAHASEGYQFIRWQGASTATDTQILVTLDTTQSVTAQFQKITNVLAAGVSPSGAGTVSLTHDTALGFFDTLSIAAVPASSAGYSFKAWRKTAGSGIVTIKDSSQLTTTLAIRDGAVTLAAVFIRQNQYTLSVNLQPLAGGAVDLSPAKQLYAYGDSVALTAQQSLGYAFTGWSGDTIAAASANPLRIAIRGNISITANFAVKRYRVLIVANDTSFGTIKTIPSPIDSVSYHDTITLIALPKAGHYFAGWLGSVPDRLRVKDTIGLRVDSSLTIAGSFAEIKYYPLSTISLPQGGGIISKSPDSTIYSKGTIVTVTAHASIGYQFIKWQGASAASDSQITIAMDTTKNLIAQFQKITNVLTVSMSPLGAGTVSLTHDTALGYFDTLRITAIPDTTIGYSFKAWRKTGGSGTITFADSTQSSTTITIRNGIDTIAAIFIRLDQYTVTVTCKPIDGGTVAVSPEKQLYAYGDFLRFSAQPNPGYSFDGWSQGNTFISASNPKNEVIQGTYWITANFKQAATTGSSPAAILQK